MAVLPRTTNGPSMKSGVHLQKTDFWAKIRIFGPKKRALLARHLFTLKYILLSVQVIVGGKTSGYRGILNSSIELFPRPPSKDCYIPDIVSDKPEAQLRRARHSLSLMRGGVLVICGGWDDHTSLDSCVSWVDGNSSWTHLFTMR